MQNSPLKFGRYDFASYAAFTMYSMCSLAIPLMIVAIGKSLDFPLDDGGMASGGILHVVRSLFMLAALLACGIIAAKIGKRLTMGASLLMFGSGMLCCSLSANYYMLFPFLMLAGFGEGICEGIATPFIQNMHKDAPERYVNIGHSFWPAGIFLAVFIIGGLGALGVNWRLILAVIGIITILTSLAFLLKENPMHKYPETKEKINFSDIMKSTSKIIRKTDFWICSMSMVFGAGAEFGLTFWSAAYIELNFNTSAFVAGLGTGTIAAGMFLGRAYFGCIAKPSNLRYILMWAGSATIPVTAALAFLRPGMMPSYLLFPVLFVLLFMAGIGIAPYWPTTQVLGVNKLPDCDSTLLYIYFSALGVPGCGFFSWLMGMMGDKFGLTGTILVVPGCLVFFLLLTWYEFWFRKK